MKTARRMMTALGMLTGIVLAAGSVLAGDLTPPGAPGPTMHTLTEIYDRAEAAQAAAEAAETKADAAKTAAEDLQSQIADMQQQLNTIKQRQGAAGFAETVGGMVLIPEGTFQMGDAFSEGGSAELPVHEVTVSAFYMDQYPVTKALWDKVRTWANDEGLGYTDLPVGGGKGPSHPVHTVNWHAAVQWANARSQFDGLTPVYYNEAAFTTVYKTDTGTPHADWSANGYRLPTEAEWEKAARGGVEGRRFPWADANTIAHTRANYDASPTHYDYDVNSVSGYHPDYSGGSTPHTSPVGSFAPNGYGLYDMAGNVSEWCWDWHGDTYYASSPGTDPRGPASGTVRVRRGGGWFFYASSCRVAVRLSASPGFEGDNLGFRLVRAAQ